LEINQGYYSKSNLHVSGDVFAHHQEHLTVFTASGNIHQVAAGWSAGGAIGEYYQML